MVVKDKPERKPTGWRLPVALRDRIASWAKGEGLYAEDVVSEWLEQRLVVEERKKAPKMGRPLD